MELVLQDERGWVHGGSGGQTDGFVVEPGGAVSLSCYHHPGAPCCGCVGVDSLKDANADVSLQVSVYFVLPVEWDKCWFVDGYWLSSSWVNMKL